MLNWLRSLICDCNDRPPPPAPAPGRLTDGPGRLVHVLVDVDGRELASAPARIDAEVRDGKAVQVIRSEPTRVHTSGAPVAMWTAVERDGHRRPTFGRADVNTLSDAAGHPVSRLRAGDRLDGWYAEHCVGDCRGFVPPPCVGGPGPPHPDEKLSDRG